MAEVEGLVQRFRVRGAAAAAIMPRTLELEAEREGMLELVPRRWPQSTTM